MIGNGQCLQKETEKSANFCYRNNDIFKQRQPDLYIVSGDKIYPTHSSVMSQCGLISNKLDKNLNSIILKPSIENQIFQIFLMFIYHPLSLPEINRDKTILTLLKAAQILQFPTLTQFIYDDFKNCFDLYCIFILYQISLQLGLQWLTDLCNYKLTSQGFKQIQLQKTQFLNLNQQTVIRVLKTHQKLKKNGVIKGLEYQQVLQILQQYCKTKQRDLKAKLLLELSDGYFSHQMGSDSQQVYKGASKQYVESEEQVKEQKNKLMQNDAKLRDLILQYECVTSPVVTLQQLQAKASISFESWSINQQNKFMSIDNDDYDKISEKDSFEEEDHSLEVSTSQAIFRNKIKTTNVPAINKQFLL